MSDSTNRLKTPVQITAVLADARFASLEPARRFQLSELLQNAGPDLNIILPTLYAQAADDTESAFLRALCEPPTTPVAASPDAPATNTETPAASEAPVATGESAASTHTAAA